MSASSAKAPPDKESIETRILRFAYDEDATNRSEVARLIADNEDALAYTFQLVDTLCALHGASKKPIPSRAMARIDAVLEEAMALLAGGGDDDSDKTKRKKLPAGGA
jgi:hypothetical protein